MEDNKLVAVTNRSSGRVGYTISNLGIIRSFNVGQTLNIPLKELEALRWESGGDYLLENMLVVQDKEALKDLNMVVEPEYHLTEAQVRDILLNGSLDKLEDTLNFGGEGIHDIIKKIAVEEAIPDTRKRDLIFKITGFNVDTNIKINDMMKEDSAPEEKDTKPVRKVTDGKPVRKVPNYEVVS